METRPHTYVSLEAGYNLKKKKKNCSVIQTVLHASRVSRSTATKQVELFIIYYLLTQKTTFETEYGEIKKFHVLRLEKEEEVALQCSGTAADAVAVVCCFVVVRSPHNNKKRSRFTLINTLS